MPVAIVIFAAYKGLEYFFNFMLLYTLAAVTDNDTLFIDADINLPLICVQNGISNQVAK